MYFKLAARLSGALSKLVEHMIRREDSRLCFKRSGEGNLDIWVQHLTGGEPKRLNDHPVDDH